jgi:hypothetical protein
LFIIALEKEGGWGMVTKQPTINSKKNYINLTTVFNIGIGDVDAKRHIKYMFYSYKTLR